MIKIAIKETLAKILYEKGIFKKILWHKRQDPLIVYYHRVHDRPNPFNRIPSLSIDFLQFEAQMRYFRKNYHVVSLQDVVAHHKNETHLESRSVAITFDDGFRDNYDLALPILKKYEIPATIFATTGLIDKSDLLWWDKILLQLDILGNEGLLGSLRDRLDNQLYSRFLEYDRSRSDRVVEVVINIMKHQGYDKITGILHTIDEMIVHHGLGYEIPRQFLSWDEIREMTEEGLTFGSHTISHRMLHGLDKSTLRSEIVDSKNAIEQYTGKSVDFFAYPDGVLDFEAKEMVRESGYLAGFQTKRPTSVSPGDIYALTRIPIKEKHSKSSDGSFSASIFSLELAGFYQMLFLRRWRADSPYDS